jgi:hypothetical protein
MPRGHRWRLFQIPFPTRLGIIAKPRFFFLPFLPEKMPHFPSWKYFFLPNRKKIQENAKKNNN